MNAGLDASSLDNAAAMIVASVVVLTSPVAFFVLMLCVFRKLMKMVFSVDRDRLRHGCDGRHRPLWRRAR